MALKRKSSEGVAADKSGQNSTFLRGLLGLDAEMKFSGPLESPTAASLPMIGGSGTPMINEMMQRRGINAGFEQTDQSGSPALESVRNSVARNAKKKKKDVFSGGMS